ncbi:MAG: dihydroorotate dehydrogenase electron transfer subunit [Kiritimatiellae bacterium]|nr:dihydroorotate dehydrogenase electron transfer subunit [Kiritimatiellia bacterium]
MRLEDAVVEEHQEIHGGYRRLVMRAPGVAAAVQPGQFVHLQIGPSGEASAPFTLRRPFSVYRSEHGLLSLIYKDVGAGTRAMTRLQPGDTVSLLGPLGRPFPPVPDACEPVLVAGGYGMAALYLLAARSPRQGIAFFGGKSREDILCVDEFERLGWNVRISTEDGSLGMKGLVTGALEAWLDRERPGLEPVFFACGPMGMLRAVGERAERGGWKAWLSLDRHMGCGLGACLTCVQKVRAADGGWTWARVCREGPVFECREVVWEEEE